MDERLTMLRELKRRQVEAYVNNGLRFTTAIAVWSRHPGSAFPLACRVS